MKYITGTYALNLPCSLATQGDWHHSALNWADAPCRESAQSLFGDWGIEGGDVPYRGNLPVANHVRALLDLLEGGYYSAAQGMQADFIANDDLTELVFDKVSQMTPLPNWDKIDRFMGKEYLCQWLEYKKRVGLCKTSNKKR